MSVGTSFLLTDKNQRKFKEDITDLVSTMFGYEPVPQNKCSWALCLF